MVKFRIFFSLRHTLVYLYVVRSAVLNDNL